MSDWSNSRSNKEFDGVLLTMNVMSSDLVEVVWFMIS